MSGVSTTIQYGNESYELTWLRDSHLGAYVPIKQVSGVIFDHDGHILICKVPDDKEWSLPGGKPEQGESLEDTLRREVAEEVNVALGMVVPLGVQRVVLIKGGSSENPYYQARMVSEVSQMLDRVEDPANGAVWEYKFVPPTEVHLYIQWGDRGKALFEDAVNIYSTSFR